MTDGLPPSLLGRLSFLLGKLYLHALELEVGELAPLGINVKQHAALTLLIDEGPMTQQEVGQRLHIDRTTVVTCIDVLEREELVERRRSPADRRAYLLTPTAEGRLAQQDGQRRVNRAEQQVLAELDAEQRSTLTTLLAAAASAGQATKA